MESCPSCRTFYESGIAMAQRLSTSADGERLEPSPFLHGKIMSAIRSEGNTARQPAAVRLGWAMAIGAACVIAVGIVWLRPPQAAHQIVSKPTPTPAQQVLAVSMAPPPAKVDQWLRTSEAPLENETKLVVDDAKTAMNTLAKSFLPDDLLSPSAKKGSR
jgi:hypothetical protein